MALFTANPVVLNDGSDDRSLTFRTTRQEAKALCGEFIENGAISAEMTGRLTIKQDESSAVCRRLAQLKIPVADTEGVVIDVPTLNITLAHKSAVPDADLIKIVTLGAALLAQSGFPAAFIDGHVS